MMARRALLGLLSQGVACGMCQWAMPAMALLVCPLEARGEGERRLDIYIIATTGLEEAVYDLSAAHSCDSEAKHGCWHIARSMSFTDTCVSIHRYLRIQLVPVTLQYSSRTSKAIFSERANRA